MWVDEETGRRKTRVGGIVGVRQGSGEESNVRTG